MKKTNNKIVNCLYIIAVLFFSCHIADAQGKVNFSGKWKINESKSKLNEQFSSHPLTVNITQSGNDLSVERTSNMQGQEITATDKYTLDGKECKNKGFRDTEPISTANWSADGMSLKIDTKVSMDNGDMTMVRVLKLDGDNLVVDFTANGPWGETTETWVYDKQ